MKAETEGRDERLSVEDWDRLPLSVRNSGQYFVSASSDEKKRRLLKLLEATGTRRLSTATWKAINAYLGESDFGEE